MNANKCEFLIRSSLKFLSALSVEKKCFKQCYANDEWRPWGSEKVRAKKEPVPFKLHEMQGLTSTLSNPLLFDTSQTVSEQWVISRRVSLRSQQNQCWQNFLLELTRNLSVVKTQEERGLSHRWECNRMSDLQGDGQNVRSKMKILSRLLKVSCGRDG